jgi:RND family efflux transporter MFP subunit
MKIMRPRLIYISFFVVVISTLILPGCGKPPEPELKKIVRPVKLMKLNNSNSRVTLEYPGYVDALRSVEFGFEVDGQIIELPIIEGQEVKKGDLLARLNPKEYKAARDAAAAHLRAMSAANRRAKRIFDQNAGSQAEVDDALRNYQVANEELKTAQKELDDTYLRAPFSGQIAQIPPDNFQNIQAKETVLLLQDLSSLEVKVSVPERDVAISAPGLTIEERTQLLQPEIEVSTVPGQRFPAKYKKITTSADPETRTYLATFSFANSTHKLILPGMTAKVILHISPEKLNDIGVSGFLIPVVATAIDEQLNSYVWRVDPNTMQVSRTRVELGVIMSKEVQVLSGLKHGDLIAISGAHSLREGMQVRSISK